MMALLFHFVRFEGIVILLWGHFCLSFPSMWLKPLWMLRLCFVRYDSESERGSEGWSDSPRSQGSLNGYKEQRHLWLHLCLIEFSAALNYLGENEIFPSPKISPCIPLPSPSITVPYSLPLCQFYRSHQALAASPLPRLGPSSPKEANKA